MNKTIFCYDAQFAHFMETLTKKGPGEWYEDFLIACVSSNVDPNDFLDAVTDIRLGQYKKDYDQ